MRGGALGYALTPWTAFVADFVVVVLVTPWVEELAKVWIPRHLGALPPRVRNRQLSQLREQQREHEQLAKMKSPPCPAASGTAPREGTVGESQRPRSVPELGIASRSSGPRLTLARSPATACPAVPCGYAAKSQTAS